MSKKLLPFLGLLILVLVTASILPAGDGAKKAAAADNELTGYLWSSNIGWISLNCANTATCSVSNYKVSKQASGFLAGYGWSSNIGWVDFAPATRNYPVGSGTLAGQARFDGNKLKGWIKALSNGGGWDGWISLAGRTTAGGAYGPVYNPNPVPPATQFSGFAWGGDVVGWVDFQYASCPSCTANPAYVLNLTPSGMVTGEKVTFSDPVGAECTTNILCSRTYPTARNVTLTATIGAGRQVTWGGAVPAICANHSSTCMVAVDSIKNVSVAFGGGGGVDKNLGVTITGDGSGRVTSNPSGINCTSGTCNQSYPTGTVVTLTRTVDANSTFVSWGGACTGTAATCSVTMSVARDVTAEFHCVINCGGDGDPDLTVEIVGNGTVTGAGNDIDCTRANGSYSGVCSIENISNATDYILGATPASGFSFSDWAGCDSVNNQTCNVSIDSSSKTVTATFDGGTCTPGESGCPPTNLFTLACSTGYQGACAITFNCDIEANCASRGIYSQNKATITSNYSSVQYAIENLSSPLFEVHICTDPSSFIGCSVDLPEGRTGTPLYLRFYKIPNANPRTAYYSTDLVGTAYSDAGDPTTTTKKIWLNFTNSAGTQ